MPGPGAGGGTPTPAVLPLRGGPSVGGGEAGPFIGGPGIGLIGPMLFSTALALAIGDWAWVGVPGLPMLIASVLMACAAVLGWRVTRAGRSVSVPPPAG